MARENLFVKAPAGMGKTHLIQKTMENLEGRRVSFYSSLRGLDSIEKFFKMFLFALRRTMENHDNVNFQLGKFLNEKTQTDFSQKDEAEKFMREFSIVLSQIMQDFLFVFEDFDQWEGREDLLPILLLLDSQNSQKLISSENEMEISEDWERFPLRPLARENVENVSEISIENLENLLNWTRGNTAFFLETAAFYPDKQDVAKTKTAVLKKYHPHFSSFKKRFTDLQWRLLRALASAEITAQPHAFDFLVKHKLGAASSVERALKNLLDTEMIERSEYGYFIKNVALQRWLRWVYL